METDWSGGLDQTIGVDLRESGGDRFGGFDCGSNSVVVGWL